MQHRSPGPLGSHPQDSVVLDQSQSPQMLPVDAVHDLRQLFEVTFLEQAVSLVDDQILCRGHLSQMRLTLLD